MPLGTNVSHDGLIRYTFQTLICVIKRGHFSFEYSLPQNRSVLFLLVRVFSCGMETFAKQGDNSLFLSPSTELHSKAFSLEVQQNSKFSTI